MTTGADRPSVWPEVPRDAAAAIAAAHAAGLVIPEACLAGVVANLALLAEHAAALDDGG